MQSSTFLVKIKTLRTCAQRFCAHAASGTAARSNQKHALRSLLWILSRVFPTHMFMCTMYTRVCSYTCTLLGLHHLFGPPYKDTYILNQQGTKSRCTSCCLSVLSSLYGFAFRVTWQPSTSVARAIDGKNGLRLAPEGANKKIRWHIEKYVK